MTDIEIAKELERQILGDKAAMPCGCVLETVVRTHPTTNSPYTAFGYALQACARHTGPEYLNNWYSNILKRWKALARRNA